MNAVPPQPGSPREEQVPYAGPERRRSDRAPDRLAALGRAAAEMASAGSLSAVASVAVRAGVAAVGADAGTVAVRDDRRRVVRLSSTDGYNPALVLAWPELSLDAPLPLPHAARTGERLLLPDRAAALSRFPEVATHQGLTDEQGSRIVAAAVLPLRARDRVLGSLALTWPYERAFVPRDVELLDALAAMVGQAMERVEQVAERERALVHERLLARSGELLRAVSDPVAVLDVAVGLLRPHLGDAAWVRLPAGTVHGDPPPVAATSTVEAPLVARGNLLGTLGCARSTGPAHSAEDRAVVRAVADRTAVALVQALLFAEQRTTSLALQRALLTPPEAAEGLQVVARYQPATRAAVGGDWYDAFVTRDGTTALAIGDVAGHDIEAAARMGQVRALLRAVAYVVDGSPAVVVADVERAAVGLSVASVATLVLARVTPPRLGGGRTLTWTSAGHLPPVLLTAAGEVRVLRSEPDLMLGVEPGVARADHRQELIAGDLVLLYTDGLVERRGQDLDDGIAELCRRLGELAGRSPGDLCDALLAGMLPHGPQDDVALLAVRCVPAD